MLTNSQKKFFKSLHQKKYRQKYNKFIVETPKNVSELLQSQNYTIDAICANTQWLNDHKEQLRAVKTTVIESTEKDLAAISNLKNHNQVVAVVNKQEFKADFSSLDGEWVLFLDDVKDPGNLGTIIRTADWFGLKTIIKSPASVDYYNSKVIQTSMGSFFNIQLLEFSMEDIIERFKNIYALSLGGVDLFKQELNPGLLILGSESHGVSKLGIDASIQILTIPGFGQAESLNVAVAGGIALSKLVVT